MTTFDTFGLPEALNTCLKRMNFTTATPIQAQAIPAALQGRDILGTAQTGTGKTAAFCVPLINHLINNPKATALVMTPTRELAAQVLTVAREMAGHYTGIRTALLIGGDSMHRQFTQLRNNPRLIVGTPGRINDHLRRDRCMLEDTSFIVLDEADRMLDMGFTVQIDEVLRYLPEQRQTLMFSATMPPKIAEFSKRYMKEPVRVAVATQQATADNISHEIARISTNEEKYSTLVKEIVARTGSIIVFVKTKRGADRMATRLQKDSYDAEAIHGDLKQSKRDRVIRDFRAKKHRILVATDVAARGLDVPHVEHVINYDLPQVAEDYIHRIGRTARAGAKGNALCILLPSDNSMWAEINGILNPNEKVPAGRFERRPSPQGRNRGQKFGGEKRFAGEKKFQPRGDRPFNKDKKFDGEKKFSGEKRFDGEKKFKPRGDRPFNNDRRPEGEARPNAENRYNGEKKFDGEKRFDGEKKFKPRGDRPFNKDRKFDGEKKFKPRGDRPFNNDRRPEGEARPNGENRYKGENRSNGENRPQGEKRFDGEKKFKPRGDRPFNKDRRPDGDRRPQGENRPNSEQRPNSSNYKGNNNAQGEKRFDGERKFEGRKKFGGPANPYRRSRKDNKNKNGNPDKGLFRTAA